jgi:hypothetical protein
MASAAMPQINPTGQNYLPRQPGRGTDGTFYPTPWTGTGGPGTFNWGNAGNPAPTPPTTNPWQIQMPPSISPTTSMFPGQAPPGTGPFPGVNPFGLGGAATYTGQAAEFGNELGKIYGKGLGSALYDFFQTGAGYSGPLTQQAVDAQIAAMQHQIQRGWGDISTELGVSGVSPESSTYALAAGDYFSNAVAQENAITAQEYFNMWSQSMGAEAGMLSDLLGQGAEWRKTHGQPFDWLGALQGALGAGVSIWQSMQQG